MQTFNLMGLPNLAFEQVVKQLETAKVIELTIASKRFKMMVQKFKLKMYTLTWKYPYSMEISSSGVSVKIVFCPQKSSGGIKKVNGTLVQMDSDYRDPSCAKLTVNPASRSSTWLTVIEDVTIHLLSIFRVKKFNFEFRDNLYNPDINTIFIWKYCRKFDFFEISKPRLSLDEMTFLSRNIETETLHIGDLRANTQFKETFNCKQLELIHPYWATSESLNSDQYTKIGISLFASTPNFFFNEVVKNWMKGGHEKLERFYARTLNLDVRSMLDGIEQTPTNFSNEELRLRSRYWLMKFACVDIRRPTDGRLATVQMSETSILVLVWHENHLELVSEETKTKLRKLKFISE